ncbi:MAG: DUF116 domain-containing protein [candidate division Zixibacteria bacterium]|nr:DUF116 domain-containing protein [candidate division Zixibacteria bacterium]
MLKLTPYLRIGGNLLAPYLDGIDNFVACQADSSWKEPDPLRLKPAETYLRNALTVGILNLLHRQAFLATDRRVIVLPACLKDYGDWDCVAAEGETPRECARCHPGCTINETVERFADERTTVLIEPEDLTATLAEIKGKNGTIGVAGVACVLTLLSGFDRTIKLQLPTQGVFLNYSSCGHHWADPAYNTDYSLGRLARVLGKDICDPGHSGDGRGETYSLERPHFSPDDFYQRLDYLAAVFADDYLPFFRQANPSADLYGLSRDVLKALVPDLITRDNA